MRQPVLIVVGGLPGSGKTTLARKLAKDLGVLAVSKDDIMERLWDAFKWDGDQVYLTKFRDATYDLLFYIAGQAGKAGKDVMLDSNFDHHFATQKILSIVEAHNFRVVFIHCKVDPHIGHRRFKERQGTPERHPSHPPRETFEEYESIFLNGRDDNLLLPGKKIELNMDDFAKHDYAKVLAEVKVTLG